MSPQHIHTCTLVRHWRIPKLARNERLQQTRKKYYIKGNKSQCIDSVAFLDIYIYIYTISQCVNCEYMCFNRIMSPWRRQNHSMHANQCRKTSSLCVHVGCRQHIYREREHTMWVDVMDIPSNVTATLVGMRTRIKRFKFNLSDDRIKSKSILSSSFSTRIYLRSWDTAGIFHWHLSDSNKSRRQASTNAYRTCF